MWVLINPHLAFPFQWAASGSAACNEQDTTDDVLSCVGVVIVTPYGYRVDEPDFGARPEEMGVLPMDLASITQAIEASEPRASVQITEDEALIRLLESHLRIYVDRTGSA